MTKSAFIPNFLRFYNILWRTALPFLRQNKRLTPSFDARVSPKGLPQSDIWIQAASAGEALLAVSILGALNPASKTRVLVTTTTDQGMEILEQAFFSPSSAALPLDPKIAVTLGWFPFDLPLVMSQALGQVSPKTMVLLETEIWPALFYALKRSRVHTLIANARMSKKSFRRYRLTSALWPPLSPDNILAVSGTDQRRYNRIFRHARISAMPNIKFDAFETGPADPDNWAGNPMATLFPDSVKLSILASVRRQEEALAAKMLKYLVSHRPDQVVAVFPRHMHRISAWEKRLKKQRQPYILRSELDLSRDRIDKGIILWDRFGEMRQAFERASAVFVGGSLTPLGGQNFIEPVIKGAPTVIGPFHDDFSWVGEAMFEKKIVLKAKNWLEAARVMESFLEGPVSRIDLRDQALAYVESHKGGAKMAARAILASLLQPTKPTGSSSKAPAAVS